MVKTSQQRIAMQSRLDICAVRYLHLRKHLARSLLPTNRAIRVSALGLYMAKGLSALGGAPGKLLGAVGEAVLKQINHGAAHWQNLQIGLSQTQEWIATRCAPTPYSQELAYCRPDAPLKQSLQRKKGLLPDVYEPIVFRSNPLLRVTCSGSKLETRLRLEGDPQLIKNSFSDSYEK